MPSPAITDLDHFVWSHWVYELVARFSRTSFDKHDGHKWRTALHGTLRLRRRRNCLKMLSEWKRDGNCWILVHRIWRRDGTGIRRWSGHGVLIWRESCLRPCWNIYYFMGDHDRSWIKVNIRSEKVASDLSQNWLRRCISAPCFVTSQLSFFSLFKKWEPFLY